MSAKETRTVLDVNETQHQLCQYFEDGRTGLVVLCPDGEVDTSASGWYYGGWAGASFTCRHGRQKVDLCNKIWESRLR